MIEKVASALGVNILEEFTIKASEKAKILGYNVDESIIYRFDTEFVHKGFNDGWDEWYGGSEKILYGLIIGLYEISK